MRIVQVSLLAILLSCAHPALADTFTMSSPAGGPLPSSVSPVGGLVTDLVGLNGTRVIAQASASSEFIGYVPGYTGSGNQGTGYLLFAQQTGITSSVLAALGGGISSAAFRVTLYDGDSKPGDFDFNQNRLLVGASGPSSIGTKTTASDGVDFGNFSSVNAERTDGLGNQISAPSPGFGNDILDTGFFYSDDSTTLTALYLSLSAAAAGNQTINFQLGDATYGDQYYDFTQGIDSSLVNVGSGPVVTPPSATPEPSSMVLLGSGLLGVACALRRRITVRAKVVPYC